MDLKELKLKNVLYFMESFVITAGGKQFKVPRVMIKSIDISKDFDSMIYPMWYVCVNVPLWFYSLITQNIDNISVSMNLQYTLAEQNEKFNTKTNTMFNEVTGNFKAVVPTTTQIGDYTTQKSIEQQANARNSNYSFNEYAFIELALYNKAAYAASFNKINAVLTSTNLTNAAAFCFTKCGINNVLMSKADNNTVYSEFKILPETGIKNIFRIVENYKFHSAGSTLFFDLTEAYLVTNKIGCYAWKSNEYKCTQIISLTEYNNTMGRFGGVFINNKEKTNVIAVSQDGFKSQDIGNNPILKDTKETQIFQIVTNHALMSLLTPNKEFLVNIDSPDNKKYNGKYRIMSYSVNMVPNGEFLEPNFLITLRR